MRGPRIKLAAGGLLAAAILSGCDLHQTADKDNGKALFAQKCGSCHVLTEAGSKGKIGPDLDAAFAQARVDGEDAGTIEGVVQRQIQFPREGSVMPKNLVHDEDAEDVASYVASVAGVPGIKPNPPVGGGKGPGGQLFASQGCNSCHTLKAATSSATIGPNLDQALKGKNAAFVMESIVDPGAKLATGFGKGIMPGDYGKKLSKKQIKDLVDFILKSVKG